jgi:hypothetical protein
VIRQLLLHLIVCSNMLDSFTRCDLLHELNQVKQTFKQTPSLYVAYVAVNVTFHLPDVHQSGRSKER